MVRDAASIAQLRNLLYVHICTHPGQKIATQAYSFATAFILEDTSV